MVIRIYKEAFAKLMEKPLKLWGISLLYILLVGLANVLFAIIPGVSLGLTILLETAMTLIFLRGFRSEKIESLQLFDCFRDWPTAKRVLCGMGWMMLWIFIWSLIPVVGPIFAIIRAYEYRLTPYILMQEPEVKPTEAIKLSKERTKGWKGKMFLADILIVVAFLLALLILGSLAQIRYIGWIFGLAAFLLYLVYVLFVTLFLGLVQSAFYEKICGLEKMDPTDVPLVFEKEAPVEEAEIVVEPAPAEEIIVEAAPAEEEAAPVEDAPPAEDASSADPEA